MTVVRVERLWLLAEATRSRWRGVCCSEVVGSEATWARASNAPLPGTRGAHRAAAQGFAAVSVEMPGAGDRTPLPGAEQARAELTRAISAGERPTDNVFDQLILPLVDEAVPEWQTTLDEVLGLPEVREKAGFSGAVIAIGTRLAATDPCTRAAGLFAGSYVPPATMDEAFQVMIPLHVLLQWDAEGNDREMALRLFAALRSTEKSLRQYGGPHRCSTIRG